MNTSVRFRSRVVTACALACLSTSGAALAEVRVTEAWTRATAPGAKTGAIYLTLVNTGDEERTLMKVVTPASDEVMIHQTSVDENGTTRMWPMAVLGVGAGQTLKLQPGGLHVMLRTLNAPLVAGQKIPLTLKFNGGEPEFTLQVEVRALTADARTRP